MNAGSLFSGIGGIDLGLERAGMSIVWQCESDEYRRSVLARHWPSVPCFEDVRDVRFETAQAVDLLAGGFPCKDTSDAGDRAGIEGEYSGLWFEFARVIRELRPRYVLVENVTGLLSRGMGRVVGHLAASGYDAEWDCLPAAAVGAHHLRAREWILAYPRGFRGEAGTDSSIWAGRVQPQLRAPWPTEPQVARVADGFPRPVDELAALGDSAVPAVVEQIGRALMAQHIQSERAA